jgi:hypothetical protein
MHEKQFDPMFDFAVREWSRVDDKLLKVVEASDEYRMTSLKEPFGALDQDEKTADSHAKLFYYQQVGHYVLGVKEHPGTREANLNMWLKLLAEPIAD